jgi:hypothetical protein
MICSLYNKSKKCNKVTVTLANTKYEECTNKLTLYKNLYWDDEFCDDKGGVRLIELAKLLNTDELHVSYSKINENDYKNYNNISIYFNRNILVNHTTDQTTDIMFDEIEF